MRQVCSSLVITKWHRICSQFTALVSKDDVPVATDDISQAALEEIDAALKQDADQRAGARRAFVNLLQLRGGTSLHERRDGAADLDSLSEELTRAGQIIARVQLENGAGDDTGGANSAANSAVSNHDGEAAAVAAGEAAVAAGEPAAAASGEAAVAAAREAAVAAACKASLGAGR